MKFLRVSDKNSTRVMIISYMNSHKMTTPQEKAQSVYWFIETKSDVQTQQIYRSKYGRDPPSRSSMRL